MLRGWDVHESKRQRRLQLKPRHVLAGFLLLGTACSLVYDVDDITRSNECGQENAACCANRKCDPALECEPSTNRCLRCKASGNDACCFASKLSDCIGDGGVLKRVGVCSDGKCTLPCSTSSSCAGFPKSICCDFADPNAPGCQTCQAPCVCKVCCGKCGNSPYQALDASDGATCITATQAHCESLNQPYADSLWSPTSC
jgi:hypothetical protein